MKHGDGVRVSSQSIHSNQCRGAGGIEQRIGMLHELTEGEDDLYELVQYVCINGQSAVTAILPKIL